MRARAVFESTCRSGYESGSDGVAVDNENVVVVISAFVPTRTCDLHLPHLKCADSESEQNEKQPPVTRTDTQRAAPPTPRPRSWPRAGCGPLRTAPARSSCSGPQTAPGTTQARSAKDQPQHPICADTHHQNLHGHPRVRQYHLRHMLRQPLEHQVVRLLVRQLLLAIVSDAVPDPTSTHTLSLGPNAATLSTTSGLSSFVNMTDMYAVSTSGITKRSTTGLVSDVPLSSSRFALVRDQIAKVSASPRLNSRTNSSRDSARIGGGSSSADANSDEDRGGGGTYGCGEPTGDCGCLRRDCMSASK